MIAACLFRRVTDRSQLELHRDLRRWDDLPNRLGLDSAPDQSTISRAERHRFDDNLCTFLDRAATAIVEEARDQQVPRKLLAPLAKEDGQSDEQFTTEQIKRTTRLGRRYGFRPFDSGRAANTSYPDNCIFELQSFMGMAGCGTAQGARRFARHSRRDRTHHGDTHLRTVKQFDVDDIRESFDEAIGYLVDAVSDDIAFRRSVVAAIDVTTVRYYGDRDGMAMVNGVPGEHAYAYKLATLSIIGNNVPLVLAVEPIRNDSPWDDHDDGMVLGEVVRRLLEKAEQHVTVHTVLCDREFDASAVIDALEEYDCRYLIPRRRQAPEKAAIERMDEHDVDVSVQEGTAHYEGRSHDLTFIYVPSRRDGADGPVPFITNRDVSIEEARGWCETYRRRWHIENQYKTIKNEFLAATSSKDYRVRLFYFAFACLLYNIWRLTDFLLQLELDYAPRIPAGEFVDLASPYLRPIT